MNARRVAAVACIAAAPLVYAETTGCRSLLGLHDPITSDGGLGQPCDPPEGPHANGGQPLVACQPGLCCVALVCVANDGGACPSGDDGGGGDSGAGDADGDDGPTVGDGSPVGCPNDPCPSNEVCCAVLHDGSGDLQCLSACPDGGAPLGCARAQNCTPQDPYCCGALGVGSGSFPDCPFVDLSAACTTECIEQFQFSCPTVEPVRLCKTSADCIGNGAYTTCCTFKQNGSWPPFCANNVMVMGAAQCF